MIYAAFAILGGVLMILIGQSIRLYRMEKQLAEVQRLLNIRRG